MKKESTIISEQDRNATIDALEASPSEFEKLRKIFNDVSDAFDDGNDELGLALIQENLSNGLGTLENFILILFSQYSEELSESLKNKVVENIKKMQELFNDLASETGNGNFTEVGDILRFDFTEFIDELSETFIELSQKLKTVKN